MAFGWPDPQETRRTIPDGRLGHPVQLSEMKPSAHRFSFRWITGIMHQLGGVPAEGGRRDVAALSAPLGADRTPYSSGVGSLTIDSASFSIFPLLLLTSIC